MNMTAPLVLSRTLNVDFRLLAVPKGMHGETRRWIEQRISSSMVYPEKLRGHQRWILLKRDGYTVVGVVCENRALAEARAMRAETKDSVGREIYLFAGYVFDGPLPQNTVLAMCLESFAPLLSYVQKHWDERISQIPINPARRLEMIEESFAECDSTLGFSGVALAGGGMIPVNSDGNIVEIYAEDHAKALWTSAFLYSGPSLSLCVGMPTRKYAITSAFDNVTIKGVAENERFVRHAVVPVKNTQPSFEEQKARRHSQSSGEVRNSLRGSERSHTQPGVRSYNSEERSLYEELENMPQRSTEERSWSRARVGPPEQSASPPEARAKPFIRRLLEIIGFSSNGTIESPRRPAIKEDRDIEGGPRHKWIG